MDSYKQPYRNDYYEQTREYPSYKLDYNSYGNEDKYKSKDRDRSGNSVSLTNCINNNVNINGNNPGDINVGNSGRSSLGPENGYLEVGSYGGNYGEGYDNVHKKDQGITCIINNNNLAGTATDRNVIEPLTCEECFAEALEAAGIDIADFNFLIAQAAPVLNNLPVTSINDICEVLDDATTPVNSDAVEQIIGIGIEESTPDRAATIQAILDCLERLGLID
jgi:hypothetical protein